MAPPLSAPVLALLTLLVLLAHKLIGWRQRIAFMRKQMPVIPVFLDPHSVIRRFLPRKWEVWHSDWMFQNRALINAYNTLPGLIPVISLYGHDNLYVSDVDAVAEITSSPQRFPKDLRVYGKWLPLFDFLPFEWC